MRLAPAVFLAASIFGASACALSGPGAPLEPGRRTIASPAATIDAPAPALQAPHEEAVSEPAYAPDTFSREEAGPASACNEQAPQEFLKRSSYVFKNDMPPAEAVRRKKIHEQTLEYRTRNYGYIPGVGSPTWNDYRPPHYARETTFFGIKVAMNQRVIPALRCVEAEIQRACAADEYKPRVLNGLRFQNTFYDGEVSNHAYGIAIDIDPDRNSCCGCLPPLNNWPRCKQPAASPFERASIPKCWVDSFAKYGFYWLGHDPLEDTMHFEFLGDPDKIVKEPAPP